MIALPLPFRTNTSLSYLVVTLCY